MMLAIHAVQCGEGYQCFLKGFVTGDFKLPILYPRSMKLEWRIMLSQEVI